MIIEGIAALFLGALAEFLQGLLKDWRHERLIRRDERGRASQKFKKVIDNAQVRVDSLSDADLRRRLQNAARTRARS